MIKNYLTFNLNKCSVILLFVFAFFFTNFSFGQIAQRGTATSATSTSNTITIAKPTGVIAGDVMIVNIASIDNNSLGGNDAYLTGWTNITGRNINGNKNRNSILYKVAGGAEPANYVFNVANGTNTTDNSVGAIIAFSGVSIASTFDVTPGTLLMQTNSPANANAITTVTANTAVIMLGADENARNWDFWSTTSPGTLSEAFDIQNTVSIGGAWATKATAGDTGTGSATLSGNGRNTSILLALRPSLPPTITSLVGSPACAGGNITINGTNLTGATSVTIGSTPVASITSNTGTQIIAVIGNGTTGTVVVTTPDGSATSAGTFTVNPLPTIVSVTGTTPACTSTTINASNGSSGTIYWQNTTSNGTDTATPSTSQVVSTSGTYYFRARSAAGCWGPQGSITVTINTTPTITTNPSPANAATGVCYSGSGAITSTSWTAVAGATSYDVYFGAGSLPGSVTLNVATNSYSTGTLLANTTYYWRVVAKNACGDAVGSSTWTFTTAAAPCYCTPPATGFSLYYIDSVSSTGTLINNSNIASGYSAGGYGNFTATTIATQIPGGGINFNVNFVNGQLIRTYVDWNKDGDFTDPGEWVYTSGNTTLSGPTTFGIVIPTGQAIGNYRMRIVGSFTTPVDSCTISMAGEAEDYTIAVVADCPAKILSVTPNSVCGTGNYALLTANGNGATTSYKWYTTATGGSAIPGETSNTYNAGPLAATTTYYVTGSNGSCETSYRTPVKATVKTTTNIAISPAAPTVCGDTDIITITAAGDTTEEDLLVQDFESGMGTWAVTIPTNTNAGVDSPWSVKTSPYPPAGTSVWKPAVNSGAVGSIGNKFALTTSDYNGSNIVTRMTSPIINPALLPSYTSLTLTFDHYYSDFYTGAGDNARVEVSINGGAFTAVTPTAALYTTDLGSASTFVGQTVNLNDYALPTTTSIQFRFVYTASFGDGWAVDNIRLFGVRPLNTTFTWSAGANAYIDPGATTTPYNPGAPDFHTATTIYVKPTVAQLELSNYSFTATATLGNGCSVVKNINVTNNTKIWKGTNGAAPTDWNVANNWLPVGVPTANDCVIIPTGGISKIINTPDALAKNLTVKAPTGNLELQAGKNLTVTDLINVESGATFNVRNAANLIQVNNVTNTGNINMDRTAIIDYRDYVYWSSPVANFNSANISATTSNIIYKWTPTVAGNGIGNFGNWYSGVENMIVGKGYIERGLNTAAIGADAPFTTTFTGVPNNGNITTAISRGTYTGIPYNTPTISPTAATQDDDNWNLIGNPYPSSIDAKAFLFNNRFNLDGYIKLWKHGLPPSTSNPDPFYNNYVYNYNSADYLIYNYSGTQTQSGFGGYIGAGQSFFTKMLDTSIGTTADFNNNLRSAAFRNDHFYRNANANTSAHPEGRIWLDLISPTATNSTLVAYVEGATNSKDQMYDAQANLKDTFSIYSLLDGYDRNIIQGRSLPFNQDDQVPLGVKVPTDGNYTIAIQGVDGLFSNTTQNIYLEDKQLNIIHDLRSIPYQFTATGGENVERFILRFANQALGTNTVEYNNTVTIFANNSINIKSSVERIKEIAVYDVLGKTLITKKNVNKNEISITELRPTTNVLIVKVKLENDVEVIKKIIY